MEVKANDRLGGGIAKDIVRFTGGSKKVVYRWLKQKFDFFKNQNCFKISPSQCDTYDILITALIAVRHLWTSDLKPGKTLKNFPSSDFPNFTLYMYTPKPNVHNIVM